jgi:hypothetical protein
MFRMFPGALAQPLRQYARPHWCSICQYFVADNAVVASRDKTIERLSLVTSRDNAVVASRDNDPATLTRDTRPGVLSQPLPGNTTHYPL